MENKRQRGTWMEEEASHHGVGLSRVEDSQKEEDRERREVFMREKKGWLSEEFLWDGGAGFQHMFGHCFDNNAYAKSNHDDIYEFCGFSYVSSS